MTVLIIIVVALIAIVVFLYFYRRQSKVSGIPAYVEAMVALLENDNTLAMKKFKEAVRIDSDLVDAYIRLGDLYRKKGDIERAIQIHQSLTVRPTLRKQEEKRVYYALVQDLLETSRYNKAISFLKEILKIDKKDKHAHELILRLYEDLGNYSDCISLCEGGGFPHCSNERLAFYYASYARQKMDSSGESDVAQGKEIVSLFKKALKIVPNSLPAAYYLAHYYENSNDLKRAKEYYFKIITHHPNCAFLVIPHLEKVLFELDSFDEVIPTYEGIFHKDPKNMTIGMALANLYVKKNDVTAAKEIYQTLADIDPDNVIPKLETLKLTVGEDDIRERLNDIQKTITRSQYHCTKCGHSSDTFEMLCPQCRNIGTYSLYC
jgi:lipopolysaccharide biosynthesis regulator YciM